jgi:uroporphyrin-III C-methyltransferase/precorrin-2 dehydrogenase/sirohydrochlorin ferrochelatase
MGYFPFMVDIEGKNCLIVGGGKVAAHKVNKLISFKPRIRVVAIEISEPIITTAIKNETIEIHQRNVIIEDIEWANFVIAASSDGNLNTEISRLCNERKIPVNVVDDKDKCSFIFPSLINNGKFTLGISTAGASPEIAAAIKNETAQFIPSGIDTILDYLSSIREPAKAYIPDDKKRARFLKDTARECMARNAVFSDEETMLRLKAYADSTTLKGYVSKGHVSLVGAGCGGYDLVTIKGIQAIRNANVLVYDDLIDDRLLDFTAESCEKIYVGKRSGRHSMKQEDICTLLVEKANEGKYVVRLKGGDPFVFGRATEEIDILKSNGIEYDYIPGITSAIAAPGLAGIPVTSRNLSRSFHVITGHTSKTTDNLPENMETIAKLNGTLIFLMGLENIRKITDVLLENGKNKDTPAAVVHVNMDNSTDIIQSTLSTIADKVEAAPIKSPAIIIVGEVATACKNMLT